MESQLMYSIAPPAIKDTNDKTEILIKFEKKIKSIMFKKINKTYGCPMCKISSLANDAALANYCKNCIV